MGLISGRRAYYKGTFVDGIEESPEFTTTFITDSKNKDKIMETS